MQAIPLGLALNGQELSKICSIFERRQGEHCQLIPRIDGIDRDFLFGNVAAPLLPPGVQLLPLAFGELTGELGPSPRIY